jgi:glucan phosphoethanolaminetransferase (alkaline phosphatase superfamily)
MASQPPPSSPYINSPTPTTTGALLTDATEMIWHKTVIRIYPVTDAKLEELTAGFNSIHLVFFGICLGAAVSLCIAFKQTSATADKPYFLFAFLAAVLGAVLFGAMGITNYIRANRSKKKLYEQSVPIEPGKVKS